MNEYTFDYVERNRLDAFCKTVLRNEAINYLSELARRRDREKPLDTLPQAEMDKLCTLDEYPSDSFVFSAFGYDLHIWDEQVAGAFATLPEQEQQILILHCVAAMADGEIGGLVECPAAPSSAPHQSPERIGGNDWWTKGGTRYEAANFLWAGAVALSVIEAARAGDPLAVERVLRYYEGYMDKLCTRTLYDLDGSPHVRVDEYMKRRLQSKLIRAILNSP